jgi:hypothetical protein
MWRGNNNGVINNGNVWQWRKRKANNNINNVNNNINKLSISIMA